MGHNLRPITVLIVLLLVLPALLLLLAHVPANTVSAAAPVFGDWTVSTSETVTDTDITLTGNLTIVSGGILTLDKVNLMMNCSFNAQFNITVKAGGKLFMHNSTVSPTDFLQRYRYNFVVQAAGQADIVNSELIAIGEGNVTKPQTLGLYIETTNVKLLNNQFTRTNIFYMASAVVVGPLASPRIEGNQITSVYPSGITFLMGSKSLVRGNTIKNNGIGISCFLSSPAIEGNELNANLVGVQLTQCDASFKDNTFRGSLFNALGAESSSLTMFNDTFIDNDADMSLNSSGLDAKRVHASGSISGVNVDHAGVNDVTFENSSLVVDGTSVLAINDSTVHLLNTTFDPAKVDIMTDSGDLHVSWFLNVSVSLASGAQASGAQVTVEDNGNNTLFQGSAELNGLVEWLPIEQYYLVGSNRTDLGPHEIKAAKGLYIGNTTQIIDRSMTVDVVLDDLMPEVNIKYPSEGFVTNRSTVTFEGNASDNIGLSSVEYKVPGETWKTVNGLTEWNFTATFSNGNQQVVVKAVDLSGNEVLSRVNITVDTVNPTLVIVRPQDGMLTNRSTVSLEGKAEPGAIVRFIPQAGGPDQNITTDAQGNFVTDLPLAEGHNKLTVQAQDLAGNTVTRAVNVVLDTKAPLLYLSAPADGLITNASKVVFQGRTEGNGNASVTVNNVPITLAQNGTIMYEMLLSDGTYNISVVARDLAGNTANIVRKVTVDTTRPGIEIDAPDENTITNVTFISVKGRAQAQLVYVGLIECDIELDIEPGWYDFDELYPLKEGLNNITVTAQDAAGNRASEVLHVTLDTIAPALSILEPLNNAETTSLQINMVGTTEPGARVTIDGQLVSDTDGSFSVPHDLVMGKNVIVVRAKDAAGNTAELVVTVTREKKTSPGTTAGSWLPLLLVLLLLMIAVVLMALGLSRSKDKDTVEEGMLPDDEDVPRRPKGKRKARSDEEE